MFCRYLTFCIASVCATSLASADNPELSVRVDGKPLSGGSKAPVVSYADVLDEATPSVVAVYTARVLEQPRQMPEQVPPGLRDFFRRQFGVPVPEQRDSREPSPQQERRERVGVGSGVIISEDGYILTNHHVIRDRRGEAVDEIRVRLNNNNEYVAELVGSDEKTDVAVLRIDVDSPLPAITLTDSDNLRVGDVVFAIGNPLEVGLTATQGIVSATGRNSLGILGRGGYEDFIQTDAAINLGNSGGALIDASGRLIGINTAIVSGSGGSIGIGFAIPINLALNVATNLIEVGEVPRGLLGLFPENLTPDLADAFGLETTRGALVNQVQEDSPAERAGIRHGDVIVKVGEQEIESAPQLRLVVSQMMPGTEVDVEIVRQGERKILPVTLGSLSGSLAEMESSEQPQGILEGVRLKELSNSIREEFEIPEEVEGVFVERVDFDSPYVDSIARLMVILEVNGQAVEEPGEIEEFIEEGVNHLYTWLGGTKRYVVIRVEKE